MQDRDRLAAGGVAAGTGSRGCQAAHWHGCCLGVRQSCGAESSLTGDIHIRAQRRQLSPPGIRAAKGLHLCQARLSGHQRGLCGSKMQQAGRLNRLEWAQQLQNADLVA